MTTCPFLTWLAFFVVFFNPVYFTESDQSFSFLFYFIFCLWFQISSRSLKNFWLYWHYTLKNERISPHLNIIFSVTIQQWQKGVRRTLKTYKRILWQFPSLINAARSRLLVSVDITMLNQQVWIKDRINGVTVRLRLHQWGGWLCAGWTVC